MLHRSAVGQIEALGHQKQISQIQIKTDVVQEVRQTKIFGLLQQCCQINLVGVLIEILRQLRQPIELSHFPLHCNTLAFNPFNFV